MSGDVISPSFYGGRDEGLRSSQEIEKMFRAAYDANYRELVYTGDDLTEIGVWEDGTKTIKLFTRTLSYTGDSLTTVTTVDERDGATLTTTLSYSGDDLTSVGKVVT